MAALYVIAAWAIVQVADAAFPGWDIPESAIRYVWYGAALGFPLALVFGWYYDFTSQGIVRTSSVQAGQQFDLSLHRSDYLILSALVLVVGVVTYGLVARILQAPTEQEFTVAVRPIPEKSIAVLPFENMSRDEINEPFTIGIHDDILIHISKISALKVISRTSVERLDTTKDMRDIRRTLGVATVLEGSVQRVGNRVRINVQLIDTDTDEHLWAESYDRQLTAPDIFAIQSEIAMAIAAALQATLTPAEQKRLETVPTEIFAAYEAYLIGKQRMALRTSVSLAEAVKYFQQAITLDVNFALAYVGLADSYQLQEDYSDLPREEMFLKAEAAIYKALRLDDQLGEAYCSLAVLKEDKNDFEGAEAAFQRALELNPNYATAHQWYGNILSSLGRFEEGLAHLRRAHDLDPLSAIIGFSVAWALVESGRFADALAQYEKVIELDPALPRAYAGVGRIHWLVSGRLDEAVIWYKKGISLDPGYPISLARLGQVYLDLGDSALAEYWINRCIELAPGSYAPNLAMVMFFLSRGERAKVIEYANKVLTIDPKSWSALAHLRNLDIEEGRYTEARARYERSFPQLIDDSRPEIDKTNYGPAIDLALILSSTGEQQRANLLLSRSLAFIQSVPRLGAGGYWIADVRIYALQGQTTKALALLREAIDQGWRGYWWYYLEHDPNLDSIRVEPEFQAMVEEIKADMAAQLERVREMEARGELEPIPDVN